MISQPIYGWLPANNNFVQPWVAGQRQEGADSSTYKTWLHGYLHQPGWHPDEEEVMKESVEREVDKMDNLDMDMDGWQHDEDNFEFSDWLEKELCDINTVHTL